MVHSEQKRVELDILSKKRPLLEEGRPLCLIKCFNSNGSIKKMGLGVSDMTKKCLPL